MNDISGTAELRTPPRVIRFAQPLRRATSPVFVIVTVAAATAGTAAVIYAGVPAVSPIWPLLIGGTFVAVDVAAFFLHRRSVAKYNRSVLDYCEREGVAINDDLINVFRSTAQGPFPTRPDRQATAYLKSWIEHEGREQGLILCVGQMSIPEIGDDRFEPYIITPSRHLFGYALVWLIATAVGGFCFYAHWISHSLVWRNPLHAVMVTVLIPIMGLGFFLYGFIARPTYVRFAPGVMDLMQFTWGTKRTSVRSFPMVPGTLVLIGSLPQIAHRVILVRNKQVDTISLGSMGKSDEALTYFWRAALSTAPTPVMSQEELLG